MASAIPQPSKTPNESQATERNRFLRGPAADSYDRLIDELEPLELSARQSIWESNARIRSVYFPRTCVISLLVPLAENGPVEAATVGNEGMVGVPLVMASDSTTTEAMVQVSGKALRIPATTFLRALETDAALRGRALRYAHSLFEQTAQSVACNRRHS